MKPTLIFYRARSVITALTLLFPFAIQAQVAPGQQVITSAGPDGIGRVLECRLNGCEVVKGILKVPATISESGHYVLAHSLHWTPEHINGEGRAIDVNAANVTIDMSGHALHGPFAGCNGLQTRGFASVGVESNLHHGFEIKNGVIRGFGTGIKVSALYGSRELENISVRDLRIDSIAKVGITVTARRSLVIQSNTLSNIGGGCSDSATAILVNTFGYRNRVINNAIYTVRTSRQVNAIGISVSGPGTALLNRNQIYDASGIGLSIDANTDMYRTAIINYKTRGVIGLRVGARQQIGVNYESTTISGFNDGVVVGNGSRLFDTGGNTVR